MKLTDQQKISLATLLQSLERAPVCVLRAEKGKFKHVITSRLVRQAGATAVLTTRGAQEKVARQYLSSKLSVQTMSEQLPHPKPQGQVTVWPVEHLQDQRVLRAHSCNLVIIDVRAEQLSKAIRAARNLLAPGGKIVVWHHGEPMAGVLNIPG